MLTLLAVLAAASTAHAAGPISSDRIKADDGVLSSDAFLERGPGEPTEAEPR